MVQPNAHPPSASLAALLRHFGLPPSCRSVQELRATYVRLAKQLHPDKNGGKGSREFGELHERYLACLHLLQCAESHARSAASHFGAFASSSHGSRGPCTPGYRTRPDQNPGAFAASFAAGFETRQAQWTYEEWAAKMREKMGPTHRRGFDWRTAEREASGGSGNFQTQRREAPRERDSWRKSCRVAGLLGVGFLSAVFMQQTSGDAHREWNERVQRHKQPVGRARETLEDRRDAGGEDTEKRARGTAETARGRRGLPGGASGRSGNEQVGVLGRELLGGEERTGKQTEEEPPAGEMLRVDDAHHEAENEFLDLTPRAVSLGSSTRSLSRSLESLRFSPAASSICDSSLDLGCSPDVKIACDAPTGSPDSSSSLALSCPSGSPSSLPIVSPRTETCALSTASESSSGDRETVAELQQLFSQPEARRAQDLLTKQYRRGTVKRRLRRRSQYGEKEKTTPHVDDLKDGGAAQQLSREGQGTGFVARVVPPVDVTRGHRGVHRESRYIAGYGGATGAGFDDYLAECEVQRELAKKNDTKQREVNGREDRCPVSPTTAAFESVGEVAGKRGVKGGGIGDGETSFRGERRPRDKASPTSSEQAEARAAADAIGAEFKRNIRARVPTPNAHFRPHWQIQN
uniref:DnaJ domain-containing protein n=1 Tax=Neospora caninum (strain Liverpool) TaxID=572307 RepID=A0A0F7U958_NEOCL|nr:TPA: DnaJ domain-containing protein [Neospora caninum Liverpool]